MVDILTYRDIHAHVLKSELKPVYLFAGGEQFLKRAILELIKKRLFNSDSSLCNYSVFYAGECDLPSFFNTARTQPFLSEKRLIVFKNIEKISSLEENLIAFLKCHIAHSVIILETEKQISDKFIKKIIDLTVPVVFYPLQGAEFHDWINTYAKSMGAKISYKAIALLVEKVGNELDALVNALNKVCLFVYKGKTVEEEDIDILIKKTRQDTRFSFLDALMNKEVSLALSMVNELSRDGKQAADIVGLINWQLRRVEQFKKLTEAGRSRETILKQLKITPRIMGILKSQSVRFSLAELDKGFRILLESDLAIKQGRKNPALALELLVVRLCGAL